MKFRTRLLILLLTVAFLPLSLSFLSQRTSILYFGNKLAADSRAKLNDSAVTLLQTLVNDYSLILERDKAMALLTLQIQAQAVESKFSNTLPISPRKIYYSSDFSDPDRQPGDLTTSSKRQRKSIDGTMKPIPVSYSQQVIYLAAGTKPQDIPDDLAHMSLMAETYQTLHDIQPELFLWQYTALESGLHSSYPGKGGYPASYDPRKRPWYKDAAASGTTVQRLITDLSTGQLILTLAKPLYREGGELLGVSALDIDYRQFFVDWNIPAEWGPATDSMILSYDTRSDDPTKRLEVLLRNDPGGKTSDWRLPVIHEYLNLNDPTLTLIHEDILSGRSGVRKAPYHGREALWAYGPRTADNPFPLLVVPYEIILAQGVDAENYVNQQIRIGLTVSALLTIFAVLATVVLAVVRARKVTNPVMQLAQAATRLAEGDFDAKVDIRTSDELTYLGTTFNALGDSLRERDQLKHSLELAKQIQQQLLPTSAPACCGFDIAGCSRYCDETGGDYYDFISMRDDGQDKIGLALGDVSGHGIASALVMAAARGILRSLADQHPKSLGPLFDNLNRHIIRDTRDDIFMTLFYGVLNPSRGDLHWLSAGQAPIFLYRDSGVLELGSSGIPLGIVNATTFGQTEAIHFIPGDVLVIGTDGIWEMRNPEGEMFGTERLRSLICAQAAHDAETILANILSELDDFRRESPQEDDITMVIVKREAIPEI